MSMRMYLWLIGWPFDDLGDPKSITCAFAEIAEATK